MKKFCILFAMIFSLSILTACSTQPVETTVTPEQTTSTTETTIDTTTETPITPPVVDSWKTAVYSKEPWWENTVALLNSVENASDGSLIIANNILMQENDALLAVEAYVVSENLKTLKDRYEFFSSFGFEMFTNEDFLYRNRGLGIPLLLASKEQLLSISFPKDYTVGFNLAFASKAFYEELPFSSYDGLTIEHEENHEYIIYLSLKNPSGHFYVSPEEARRLWPIVYEKHPLLPRPSSQDESDTSLTLAMTEKKLYELLASDGFFDDFKVEIAYSRPGM